MKTTGVNTPARAKHNSKQGMNVLSGMHIGVVTDVTDSINTGRVKVRIAEFGSNRDSGTEYICNLVTPFGGVTQVTESLQDDEKKEGTPSYDGSTGEQGSPSSYGMWPQPPAVGTEVIVAFTASRENGFIVGTLISKDRNHMMGGNASAENIDEAGEKSFGPTVEQNPYKSTDEVTKPKSEDRQFILDRQGLSGDFSRGHSSSSARRESPSKVFGITTLGGHTVSLDDGDVEGANTGIRIRSKMGAQILIDDSKQFIFITNHAGNAWIELDAEGRMDVFTSNHISMHTEADYNVHAKGDINMQADGAVNIKSTGGEGINLETTVGAIDTKASAAWRVEAMTTNITSSHHKETAGRIDMNGPTASKPDDIIVNSQVSNRNILESISSRVPEKHPWLGASSAQEVFNTAKGKTA